MIGSLLIPRKRFTGAMTTLKLFVSAAGTRIIRVAFVVNAV